LVVTSLAESVEKCAAWLDIREPDWVDRIDLATLDISEPCLCVGGQLAGTDYGWEALSRAFMRDHRFDYWDDRDERVAFVDPDATDLWRREVSSRRASRVTESVPA
jgi:hypothetical protein